MNGKFDALRQHVVELAANSDFVHHKWFVKWHLMIVEKLALELCEFYPEADRDIVLVMAWMHDYGKILDFDQQYEQKYKSIGRDKMIELGFEPEFADKVAEYIEIVDRKIELDKATIEVQIISSADGCSHLVGPFIRLWWWEHPDQSFEEIMTENIRKISSDWEKKIVLPEAKQAFLEHYNVSLEQSGKLPDKFF